MQHGQPSPVADLEHATLTEGNQSPKVALYEYSHEMSGIRQAPRGRKRISGFWELRGSGRLLIGPAFLFRVMQMFSDGAMRIVHGSVSLLKPTSLPHQRSDFDDVRITTKLHPKNEIRSSACYKLCR